MHYLYVPKGEEIMMVYDGKSGGLNDDIWAPHFDLSMVASMLRKLEGGTYMADRDIG